MFASLYSAATWSCSSVSPGRTCVNATGSSVISIPPAVWRATVKRRGRELARLRKIGAEMRAAAEFSRFRAASAIDPADLDERAQIEPIVPGQVEGTAVIGETGRQQLRLDRVERRDARDRAPRGRARRRRRPTWYRAAFRAARSSSPGLRVNG